MAMVQVGIVRVTMDHRRVPMDVDMRLPRDHARPVLMPMVPVVDVGVLVHQLLVLMLVFVVLD